MTHNLVSDISLNDDFILALRILRDTASCSELACKLLGGFLEIHAKQLETVYVGLMLSPSPL
jgi:hypothetical protein